LRSARWGPELEKAKDEALEWWPNTTVPGALGVELATPEDFESVAELVTVDHVAEKVVCGPDAGAIGDESVSSSTRGSTTSSFTRSGRASRGSCRSRGTNSSPRSASAPRLIEPRTGPRVRHPVARDDLEG
jgi:hypothetical protein